MKQRLILCAIALLMVVTGCVSHRTASRPEHNDWDSRTESVNKPQYFTANFTCSAQGMEASGQLRMQPDSIVWLSASKVIELARATFTTDSVTIYAKVMGRCFRGTYEDFNRRFHYRTTFADMVKILTSNDADTQIAAIAKLFGADITVSMEPWKRVENTTFPMAVPSHVKPL